MDGEPMNYQRMIWIALTVLVVAIAAYAGVVISQQSLDTPSGVEAETPDVK